MAYPDLKVMGSPDSGLIITADLPPHLAGNNPSSRSLVLTPHQSKELWRQLCGHFGSAGVFGSEVK